MGTHLFVVKNVLHLFVARNILARYGVYRWDNFLHQISSKNDMGKYDGQACPAIVFSHMVYWRYNKPKNNLIITDLLMESNPHLINTNHIVLYYTPTIV